MAQERLIITIDGPAGTGKSTVAHRLARRLGMEFLDTGAMYRAACLLAIERRIDPSDGARLAEELTRTSMEFDWSADPPALLLGGRHVSERIRDLDVSRDVSTVAGQKRVREVLVEKQREIAREHPQLVTEGRDQGSVVFPDADLRVYLDASPEVRARRRYEQLREAGKDVTFESVLEDVRNRDELDSTRQVGPLVRPEGAVVVDSSNLSLDDTVDCLERIVREHIDSFRDSQEFAARGDTS